jgi:bifunctional non-homologous end joining protein LigD
MLAFSTNHFEAKALCLVSRKTVQVLSARFWGPAEQTIPAIRYTRSVSVLPRNLRPIRLSRRPEPFDSDDYIFELKIDGFRSLAYIENDECELVSRNGNTFRNFKDLAQWIGENLRIENAVIDGEIACVDDSGRSVFNDLLFRRRECVFFAFDLLYLNGEDLRALPLVQRKARLKRLLLRKRSRIVYVDHIETHGERFFEKVCALDLEGIVAKRRDSPYRATERPSPYWIKIKNGDYTQAEGREELFDPAYRMVHTQPR